MGAEARETLVAGAAAARQPRQLPIGLFATMTQTAENETGEPSGRELV
jgi:hypothetical protein